MMKNNLTSTLTDEQLVMNLVEGDQGAMGTIYERYYLKVYQKCGSFTSDDQDAFDLVQDIMLKVFYKSASFKGESRFSTWLYALTHNHCLDFVRKNENSKVSGGDHMNDMAEEEIDLDQILADEILLNQLQEILQNNEDADCLLLLMKYEQKLTIKELQDRLGVGASAVKMRLLRAKKKIVKLCGTQCYSGRMVA